jgi:phosphoglycolate phosphatase
LKFYKQFDTFVFDYDGTLFDSLQHIKHVFTIVGENAQSLGIIDHVWDESLISSVIGHNPKEAWKVLLPYASDEVRLELSALYSKTMSEHLSSIQTQWYPHATEVIEQLLSENKICVLLTNARRYYVDIALAQHPVLQRFEHVVCAQDFNYQSKSEIIKQLSLSGSILVIGDKIDDALAAQSIQAQSLWASYGYGQDVSDGMHFTNKLDSIYDLTQKPSI